MGMTLSLSKVVLRIKRAIIKEGLVRLYWKILVDYWGFLRWGS